MKTYYPIITITLLAACPLFADEPKDWNVRDHIPLQDVVVMAHRGAGVSFPENTLEAFETAWKLGTIPEADIKTTRDGVVVAFHDLGFSRILPTASDDMKKTLISDLSYEEVAKLDVGIWRGEQFAGQRIPRLSEIIEVLKKHPQRKMYLDIKEGVVLEELALKSQGVHSQIIVMSSNYDQLKRWKRAAPDSFTLHWMGVDTEEKITERLGRLKENQFRDIDQLQQHIRINKDGNFEPSEAFLKQMGHLLREHKILFQMLPWEGKDVDVYHRLLDMGVASFATDYPDVTMRALTGYYTAKRR